MARKPLSRRRPAAPQIKVVACWNTVPKAPDLRSIHDLWRAVNGALDMGWTPEAIIELIRPFHQQALVTEVIGRGHDFRSAIVGAQWTRLHGGDVTGTLLSEYTDKEVQRKTRILFNKVVSENRPAFFDSAPLAKRRWVRRQNLEMVFLPLIGLEGAVTHFITAMPLIN